ncbi:MAG: hypothetical protein IIX45_02275 [Lachnospiraceae bacterium]|nr:hypothetical protein [Lachnospiraceae bacterium]
MNENNQNQPYNYNDQSDNVHNNQTYNNVSQNPYNVPYQQAYNGMPQQQPYGFTQIPTMEAQQAGQPIPPAPLNPYGYNQGLNPQAYMQTQMYPPNEEPQSGFAVASLIIGIIAIIGSLIYGLGAILGVAAIVFAIISRSFTRDRLTSVAIGGLVCGVVAIILGIFIFSLLLRAISY